MSFRTIWVLIAGLLIGAGCAVQEDGPGVGAADLGGYPLFDESAAYRLIRAEQQDREEQLAICMEGEGFEYYPEVPEVILYDEAHEMFGSGDYDDAEFAELFGFGLVTLQPFYFDVDPGDEAPADLVQPKTDQEQYLLTLSAADEVAYAKVIKGCREELDGDLGPRVTDQYAERYEDVLKLKLQFSLDSEVVEYYGQWSKCMKDEGYSYETPIGAFLDLDPQSLDVIASGDQAMLETFADLERSVAISTVSCGASSSRFLPAELEHVWNRYSEQL